ncbi:MAG: F-type H+-transporting ATPase subunit gamma [Motiliproteus sp.]|jgi:F-type H+-transporting ATPase subunit gamma
MSETVASLRHKMASAGELEAVVRTMKGMAASSIGQYENAVRSLDEYYRTVELGLAACFQQAEWINVGMRTPQRETAAIGVVVFGSDQGLVGQFNEVMVDFVTTTLTKLPGHKMLWAVGERIQSRLADTALPALHSFPLPNSIGAITALVGNILIEVESQREKGNLSQVHIFHNRPQTGAIYRSVSQRLLPLDEVWRHNLAMTAWPTQRLPEVMHGNDQTLPALIREYLFVSIFRACAESLASENASRLAAMQRAGKNIDELQGNLHRTFHRLRQSGIDEELFDVISGFEALTESG